MTILTVNKVAFPNPSEYGIDTEPMGMFERNAKGDLVGDYITTKVKIRCKWAYLHGTYVSMLHKAVAPFFCTVTFMDFTGGYGTYKMYASPQSASLAWVYPDSVIEEDPDHEKFLWKDVSVNLIEV